MLAYPSSWDAFPARYLPGFLYLSSELCLNVNFVVGRLALLAPIFLFFLYSTYHHKWQPTPVFLPGKSYGQRGLVGLRVTRVGHDLMTKPPPIHLFKLFKFGLSLLG